MSDHKQDIAPWVNSTLFSLKHATLLQQHIVAAHRQQRVSVRACSQPRHCYCSESILCFCARTRRGAGSEVDMSRAGLRFRFQSQDVVLVQEQDICPHLIRWGVMRIPLCGVIGGPKGEPGWARSAYHPTKSGDRNAYHTTLRTSMHKGVKKSTDGPPLHL